MYCERRSERGKQNPNRLAGGPANEKPRPGCGCILTDQWQLARSRQGRGSAAARGSCVRATEIQRVPEPDADFVKGKSKRAFSCRCTRFFLIFVSTIMLLNI